MPDQRSLLHGKRAVFAGVAIAVIVFGLQSWVGHFARASESHGQTEQNEQMLEQVVLLVTELGERAKADDAKRERDAELCIARTITDRDLCAAAGVEIP